MIFVLWFYYQNQLVPVSPKATNYQDFGVAKGQSLAEISENLQNQKLIKKATAFRIFVQLSGLATKLQAGSYRLSPAEDAKSIAAKLTAGFTDVWITIPEGLRMEEVADKLAEVLPIDQQHFLKNSREGYMFPDTYRFPKDIAASQIAKLMLNNFSSRLEGLQEPLVKSGLSQNEVIILASLVEREVKFDNDRPIVAGILLSRYQKSLPLEVDATVQYALGFDQQQKTYWKNNLTDYDLKVNSPYNTRKFASLPPGPICSPGLVSIKAVLAPTKTDYFYYLSDQAGKIYYARTLEEHIANINKYL